MRMSMRHEIKGQDPSERTTITLPRSLARRLRMAAETSGMSLSGFVRKALDAYLGQEQFALPSFTGSGSSGRKNTAERAEELIASRMRRSK